jgi:hypothetical protein
MYDAVSNSRFLWCGEIVERRGFRYMQRERRMNYRHRVRQSGNQFRLIERYIYLRKISLGLRFFFVLFWRETREGQTPTRDENEKVCSYPLPPWAYLLRTVLAICYYST